MCVSYVLGGRIYSFAEENAHSIEVQCRQGTQYADCTIRLFSFLPQYMFSKFGGDAEEYTNSRRAMGRIA
jgi:uncharacterized protein YjhX (UPF0386 family)